MTRGQSSGVLDNLKVAIIIAIILFVGFFLWDGISRLIKNAEEDSKYDRLNEVLAACTESEDSARCKNLQKKYDITFKYCKSIFDSVQDQYKIVYLPDGSQTIEFYPIWHAVVWEGSSSTPPNGKNELFDFSGYRDCVDHRK